MSSAAESTTAKHDTSFLRSRLGSALAVFPLGVWTVAHLFNNLSAFKGAAAWQQDVTEYKNPVVFFTTSIIALLPLVLHTIWGIGRLLTVQPNNVRYGFFSNQKYLLQRISAVGILFFLGAHIWLAMLHPRITTGRPEVFADISHEMHHHLPTLLVYVLGTLGVAYHLANGLQTFAMGWGVVTSHRALKRLGALVYVTFALLLAMCWGTIYALYEAGT
ncbi:MAG: Succinate dehydrogenase cytochrome b558 subunit [Labilithrix sp.]|nr:Succinate dehydrogenase cytochrome b558 subunit [Labilithrix sp.]